MERKALLSPLSRNKKAPKAPESGTPRGGNQLVRMRSQYHLLKDMETGTAPKLTLSNTNASDTAKMQETGGHTRPPVFSCSPSAHPSPAPKSHAPQGIQVPAIPTGASLPHSSTDRRGIATARTKPLAPPCTQPRQPPTPHPWRAAALPTISISTFTTTTR